MRRATGTPPSCSCSPSRPIWGCVLAGAARHRDVCLDAATRLAYQLRDEASALQRSGQSVRTFEHRPKTWLEGMSGGYRIEITETETSPPPGHRSIGVARNLTEPTWYSTSYHLNFLEVPKDLVVSHAKDEPTIVTLELKDGKVLLTGLN